MIDRRGDGDFFFSLFLSSVQLRTQFHKQKPIKYHFAIWLRLSICFEFARYIFLYSYANYIWQKKKL